MRLPELSKTLVPSNEFVRRWKNQGKPVLGYSCSYTPEEIIFAGGCLPVRILGSLEPSKLADVYLPVNVCSFAKSCLNQVLKDEHSLLDGYVVANSCDNQNKIYDVWRYCTSIKKTHFINTPHSTTENALEFFIEELEMFKEWLRKNFDSQFSDEKLVAAIKLYNENRRLLKQVYELRKQNLPPILGSEVLEVVLSSMMIPKSEHNKILHELLSEIKKRENPIKEGARLLVSGSIMDDSKLLKLIESVGGCIVADDLCSGSRYFWNLVNEGVDPTRAIAERYLRKIPCPFLLSYEERFKHVRDMVKAFDVEGVLIFSIKSCDVYSFDAPLLAEELRKEDGLPVLCLEWEHSLSGVAQLRTRIEAFIEMLED